MCVRHVPETGIYMCVPYVVEGIVLARARGAWL